MTDRTRTRLRSLPSVDRVLRQPGLTALADRYDDAVRADAARRVLDRFRAAIIDGDEAAPDAETVAGEVARELQMTLGRSVLGGVINATGVLLHTGLGRAPLAPEAVAALQEVAAHYAPVELNMHSGARGRRATLIRPLLRELTGAESATAVNNTAAALVITLATLARQRTVIVSRGELIEIGGSFRLPDIMTTGGAVLREVGTTNRTRLADYAAAIDEHTAMLMKVHTSNYRVEGFTESVDIGDLVELAHERGLPAVHDIGSGVLDDSIVPGEPDARRSIAAGCDLVLFSGDKLLGGPQAGIIVGRAALIDRIERHPLMRAMRLDKLVLGALAATLQLHRAGGPGRSRIPVLAMLHAPVAGLRSRAEAIVPRLPSGLRAEVRDSRARIGGGSVPVESIPSVAVRVTSPTRDEDELATALRAAGVVGRVHEGAVWLDLRTVFPGQDAPLVEALRVADARLTASSSQPGTPPG